MAFSRIAHRHCIGITRRELLQVGYSGLLGLGLPALISRRALAASSTQPRNAAPRQAKSVILIFLTGVPNGVMLPTYLNNGYGFSGQHAGVLGPKYDPWHIKQDPNEPAFRVENLQLPIGLTADQFNDRRALLEQVDRQRGYLSGLAEG